MAKTRALRQQPTRTPPAHAASPPAKAPFETPREASAREATEITPRAGAQPPRQSPDSTAKGKPDARAKAAAGDANTSRVADFQNRNIQIQIPSSAEYVRVVRLAVLGVASRMPFSYDDVEDIKLAVSEACNNAILHSASEAARTAGAATGHDTIEAGNLLRSGNASDRAASANTLGDSSARSKQKASTSFAVTDEVATDQASPATRHGSSGGSTAREAASAEATFVLVTMTPWPDRLEITIADEGFVPPPGLSALVPAAPREAPDALRESGLGLFLMQALMDQVEHGTGAASNTVVRLVKYLPRAASRPD